MRMSQVKLNVEYTEHNGIYSIKIGNRIIELDESTFKQSQVTTYDNENTHRKEEQDMKLEQQYKSFFEENPNFYAEIANETW